MQKYILMVKKLGLDPRVQIASALLIGLFFGSLLFSENAPDLVQQSHEEHAVNTIYTCSMHPQVRLDEPGQCPICFMDLIPLVDSAVGQGSGEISLSETAVALAHISTTPVRMGEAIHTLSLPGRVDYDETRIKNISAWFPGRLERLYVDYTGIRVTQGDHLFDIYSTDLYAAQEELLQADRRLKAAPESSTPASLNAFKAAREKVRLLGLSELQINALLQQGSAQSTLQINSPITGVVTHKRAKQGSYVKTGDEIYTIVDLSHVWLILEAYEKDLPWLAYGQSIEFQVSGVPGKTFKAQISYIDPMVDPISRSITVRAVLDNRDGDLKPGMLVQSQVSAQLNGRGEVINPALSGKWTCPMHPEVLKSRRGSCDVCGMDLVPVKDLFGTGGESSQALLIPASAVFKTGNRALVYVESTAGSEGLYELREVVLGPRAEDDYIVLSGLAAGEQVVTQGNFKIDSALQISGKTSMMSLQTPQAGSESTPAFRKSFSELLDAYLDLQSTLAADQESAGRKALNKLLMLARDMDKQADLPVSWTRSSETYLGGLQKQLPPALAELRTAFEGISKLILAVEKDLGHDGSDILYEAYCPMAFDNRGAFWLQAGKEIKNPYFGKSMLSCGEIKQSFSPLSAHHE